MASLEIQNFCSLAEYERNRAGRIWESDIRVGELYTYMMRLDHPQLRAAKHAVRVEKISGDTGLVAVKFAFLNDRLDPILESTELMEGGIINELADAAPGDPESSVEEAYLRDYYADLYEEMLTAGEGLPLLVGAGQ